MSGAPDILCVENLDIRRGRVRLLTDLYWRIRPGERWAIIGANGSGKTSLLGTLAGLMTPTKGSISVLGEIYGETDWTRLRHKIGIVSSSLRQMMDEGERTLDIVASGRHGQINFWGKLTRRDLADAMAILEEHNVSACAERPWAVLSQGERQKVLIARALMMKPALLILDEPCAGLDPASREHFLTHLETLTADPQAPTLVLVTHHVEEILPSFTHVLALKDGRVFCSGEKKNVLTARVLSGLFGGVAKITHRNGRSQLQIRF